MALICPVSGSMLIRAASISGSCSSDNDQKEPDS